MQNHRALFKYAGKSIFVPAVLTLLRSFFSSVLLVLVSKQIVEAVVTKDVRDLVLLECALGAVLLMIAWTNAAYKRSRFQCVHQAVFRAEDALLHHHKNMDCWRAVPAADVLGMVRDTAYRASGGAVDFVLGSAQLIGILVGTGVYTLLLNPTVFLIVVVYMVLMILWTQRDTSKLPELYERFFGHLRALDKKIWEQVRNHEAASLLNQQRVQQGYHARNELFLKDLMKSKISSNKVTLARKFGPLFLMVIVALVGGILYTKGVIEISSIYAMVVMIPSFAGAMSDIPSLVAQSKECSTAMKMLEEYLASPEAPPDGGSEIHSIDLVAFSHVNYAYPGQKERPALHDVSFQLKKGMHCIIGESGSGKSTALMLLMRLFSQDSGTVLVNGNPIANYNRSQYFKQIGYAGQKPTILTGTIRWNILLGSQCDEERLNGLLLELGLKEWIDGLENKLDTQIDGDSLSSGEKQKISMARLLYRKASMLVLDEATSAMDPASEQLVIHALKRRAERGDVLILSATHSVKLADACDCVYRMEQGTLTAVR